MKTASEGMADLFGSTRLPGLSAMPDIVSPEQATG